MHREAHDSPEGKILVVVIFVSFVGYAFFAPSMIEAQAKKEGALTLYTTIAEKDLPTLIKPFESKYGVKVTVWRAGTSNVLQRALQETSAKKYDVDVIHIGSPEMEALAREQVLLPITSPVQNDLQPGSVPAHRQWSATLLSVWVQAYNTKLINKASLPRTYRDLLDPRWKGGEKITSKLKKLHRSDLIGKASLGFHIGPMVREHCGLGLTEFQF